MPRTRFLRLAARTALGLTLVHGACARNSLARPIDARAADVCVELAKLVRQPAQGRRMGKHEAEAYATLTRVDSADVRLCAVVALAFAGDEATGRLLSQLVKQTDPIIAGAASYALRLRESAGRKPDEAFGILCFWLGRSRNPVERMLLANRIAVDFGDTGAWAIAAAASQETDDLARANDEAIAKEALRWQWDEGYWFPENLAFLMGSLTPGRPRDALRNSCKFLLRQLKQRPGGE